jgi:hypothetical protein
VYSIYQGELAVADPFDARGAFYQQADRANLLKGADLAGSINALNYNKNDRFVRMINGALRWTLKLIGGARYTMLMKYLSYISILRYQRAVIGWKLDRPERP